MSNNILGFMSMNIKYAANLKLKQNKPVDIVDPVKFAKTQFNEEDLCD